MKLKTLVGALVSAALLSNSALAWRIDDGHVFNNSNKEVRFNGVNWFGFETSNYTPHGLWAVNWKSTVTQMKSLGFNAVRVPFCPNTLKGVATNSINYGINPDLAGLNSLQLLDKVVQYLSDQGMAVLLDHHRPDCEAISELWYTGSYTEAQWIADLKLVAGRYKGLPGFMGIDLKNEPHGAASWSSSSAATDWNKAAERAAAAVLAVNPDVLVFVEGISANTACSDFRPYFWGGNITPLKCFPLDIPREKLVLSPHVYGPDVFAQPYFSDANFPNNMPAIWDAQWGFAAALNHLVVPGEFGGKYGKGDARDKSWQDKLVSYMIDKRITNFFYWSWNPNSGDTGGILQDDWKTPDANKVALLNRLIAVNASVNSGSSSSAASSHSSSAASSVRASSSSSVSSSKASSSSRSASSSAASSTSSSASSGAGGVTASYTIDNDWGSGYCAALTVTNTGSAAVTWRVALNVAGKVTQAWNANWSQSGSTLTVNGLSWNGTLPPKASDGSIGFCATR